MEVTIVYGKQLATKNNKSNYKSFCLVEWLTIARKANRCPLSFAETLNHPKSLTEVAKFASKIHSSAAFVAALIASWGNNFCIVWDVYRTARS